MYIKTGRDAWSFQITLGIPALQNVFMKYSKNTSTLNKKGFQDCMHFLIKF